MKIMKFLFIYPNVEHNSALPAVGLSALTACLREAGHEVELLDFTYKDKSNSRTIISKKLDEFDPGIVGISIRSLEWDFVTTGVLPILGEVGIPVIVGGPHPTAVPEEVMEEPAIHALVQGEGEAVLVDYVNSLENNRDATEVEGLWVRTTEGIRRSDIRPLVQDLDSLPFPAWDIWDSRHFHSAHHEHFKKGSKIIGAIESSRGCPYACPYCISSTLHKLYKGKGRFHREKSIDRLIAEVLDKKKQFGLDYVNFIDDTFLLRDDRIAEFHEKWKRDVKLPFRFTTRPETVKEERIRLMADAGANVICLGIESGDPDYRKNFLNRNYSQEQVRSAVEIIKKHGITTFGFFVIGMPGETRENIGMTYELLRSLDLDHYMVTLCYPFKGTPFYDVAVRDGLFVQKSNTNPNVWEETPISLPGLSQKHLIRLRYLISYFGRKSPRWRPVLKVCESSVPAYNVWRAFRKIERKFIPSKILD